MERRDFLGVMAGLMAATPILKGSVRESSLGHKSAYNETYTLNKNLVIGEDKVIRYVGKNMMIYAVVQLHHWLQDKADEAWMSNSCHLDITCDNPSVKHSDHLIELVNGYTLHNSCLKHFSNGSILIGDEIYTSHTDIWCNNCDHPKSNCVCTMKKMSIKDAISAYIIKK